MSERPELVPWKCGCGTAGEAASEKKAWQALLAHWQTDRCIDNAITVTVEEARG